MLVRTAVDGGRCVDLVFDLAGVLALLAVFFRGGGPVPGGGREPDRDGGTGRPVLDHRRRGIPAPTYGAVDMIVIGSCAEVLSVTVIDVLLARVVRPLFTRGKTPTRVRPIPPP